jgi:glyoxylase-like metal-dependent hydrolase (beta-lactamase superfamily II)
MTGRSTCGVFNVDRAQAVASLRRLAGLDTTVACFGHGEPLARDAAAQLQAAAQRLPSSTGQHASDTPPNER